MIPECTLEELVDFPRRMREWLFNVMDELSERSELSNYYQTLQKEAKVLITPFPRINPDLSVLKSHF
jgi:hypothetical protein